MVCCWGFNECLWVEQALWFTYSSSNKKQQQQQKTGKQITKLRTEANIKMEHKTQPWSGHIKHEWSRWCGKWWWLVIFTSLPYKYSGLLDVTAIWVKGRPLKWTTSKCTLVCKLNQPGIVEDHPIRLFTCIKKTVQIYTNVYGTYLHAQLRCYSWTQPLTSQLL